jgi:phosphate transport system permease protein
MTSFFMNDVSRLARGLPIGSEPSQALTEAAGYYGMLLTAGRWVLLVAVVALAAAGLQAALRRINPQFRARNQVERWVAMALFAAAAISILTTAGIVFSVLFESLRFFQRVPVTEFLFGTQWSPQTAIRADQVGSTARSARCRCSPARC